ncbi:MAG: carboxypeptidase-like regulatory domain-containing protein, partial [Acidobacteriota bacterium]
MLVPFVAFLFCSLAVRGQTTGITGVVSDPQGAVISGAKILVQQTGGASYSATTNSDGLYVIPNLVAAEYTITVSASGFSTAQKHLLLLVGQLAQINITLSIASAATSVVVEAENAIAIDTTSSQ